MQALEHQAHPLGTDPGRKLLERLDVREANGVAQIHVALPSVQVVLTAPVVMEEILRFVRQNAKLKCNDRVRHLEGGSGRVALFGLAYVGRHDVCRAAFGIHATQHDDTVTALFLLAKERSEFRQNAHVRNGISRARSLRNRLGLGGIDRFGGIGIVYRPQSARSNERNRQNKVSEVHECF